MVGIGQKNLHLYERRGLLEPVRTSSGTRQFDNSAIQRTQRGPPAPDHRTFGRGPELQGHQPGAGAGSRNPGPQTRARTPRRRLLNLHPPGSCNSEAGPAAPPARVGGARQRGPPPRGNLDPRMHRTPRGAANAPHAPAGNPNTGRGRPCPLTPTVAAASLTSARGPGCGRGTMFPARPSENLAAGPSPPSPSGTPPGPRAGQVPGFSRPPVG